MVDMKNTLFLVLKNGVIKHSLRSLIMIAMKVSVKDQRQITINVTSAKRHFVS